jgi:16S rRNA (adenine1518-N6/adenine1519-N6)-dimethyltransferase
MGWIKDALLELEIRPSKQRGQNFLSSIQDAKTLVREAGLTKGDHVIEVGPGLGAMTQALLEEGVRVDAVEIEPRFVEYLTQKFRDRQYQFTAHLTDFRVFDPSLLSSSSLALVSNVPYVFSTEMLLWMIRYRDYIKKGSLLLQKEFAERVGAPSGSRTYGSLSVFVQLFYSVRLGVQLPGDAFHPKAEVASQQLHLLATDTYFNQVDDIDYFEKVVRASFSMRRKMLLNCLLMKEIISSRNEGENLLSRVGISLRLVLKN